MGLSTMVGGIKGCSMGKEKKENIG